MWVQRGGDLGIIGSQTTSCAAASPVCAYHPPLFSPTDLILSLPAVQDLVRLQSTFLSMNCRVLFRLARTERAVRDAPNLSLDGRKISRMCRASDLNLELHLMQA